MRIGIDTRLQNESGVGRYIRNLLLNLRKLNSGHEYVSISPDIKWHSIKEQLIMPFLLGNKYNLVHFPYFNVPIFYSGKYVMTVHDLIINTYATGRASTLNPVLYWLKRMAYLLVLSLAVRRACRVIVPSFAVKEQLLQAYNIGPEKISVIYEGVDKKLSEATGGGDVLNRYQLKGQQYLLYVGNAYPHKNLETLLVTFDKIREGNLKLILVGKYDYFYNQFIAANMNRNIIFTGYVEDNELAILYREALLLIQPSLMEGFSLPTVEAMARGCPVLCSDIPVHREICLDAALYFKSQDSQDLYSKLMELIADRDKRNNLIEKGKARVTIFSWEDTAALTLQTYESCFSL
ncbi:hypothetical protein COW99_01650 [Candidatus Roizmanbacteria bacterium CG22_combo_CG10-13_8_21_14_all_38_20]|uniref:Glycosyl transferase family 1 n=1 Tax=Candidatus Roizmanbacteria bacterium CG22_combo_CG10-13_8_21_14_all_38_20 TaxID=1974862 RepID=A0A2H0BWI5_9BACT|nr:glycosyltransferase family 4 protein [Candidatus Microgenomates bacterium]PIP61909.1 MAG: hypothetical protein COW99_01650 [Candidatus Roizmanbacteria bacterium CG22_combo_CG10-13_8_21_14_all_38_20]PJC32116.1 MAG: hypothetical protein CO050_01305 [Candidatus Roizmanbacteria bacterium CG_4_9_14_0_2_um_filter_38_17]